MNPAAHSRSFLFLLDQLEAGGVQRDVLKIGRALVARGDVCTVAAFHSTPDSMSSLYREAGLEVAFLGKRRGFDWGFIRRLRRFITEGEFDFVHALSPRVAFWGALAMPSGRRPVFASFLFNTYSYNGVMNRILETIVTARRVDAAFVNSGAGRRHYRKRIACPPRLLVVPNGVDPAPTVDRKAARRELGIRKTEFAVAGVGRLVSVKRFEDIIRAAELLKKRGTALRLFILGDGPCRRELEALADSLGVAEEVTFCGERSTVRRLLPAFDAFVLSSESEGMPNALLEAMAAGLPCVATRVGGVQEVIRDRENGILVPPARPDRIASALGELARSDELRRRLGKAARGRVETRFSLSRMTGSLLSHYDRMLVSRRSDIAFVFSQFPKVSETFLLRELVELERRGKRVCVVSLKASREPVRHPAARKMQDRVIDPPWFGGRVAWENVRQMISHPLRYAGAFLEMGWLHRGYGKEWLKCLAAWPKTVAAARAARCRGVRHVHAAWATVPASSALVMARLLGCRFSFSAHAFDIYGYRHPLARKIQKAAFVSTCTQRNVDHLRSLVPEETGDRIQLVRHFAEIPASEGAAESARPQEETPIVLCVGSLERYKGHDVLLNSAKALLDRGIDFRVRIVGGGPEEKRLRALAHSLGLEEAVEFFGPLPNDRVAEEYSRATVFALASIRNPRGGEDNLPNVLVEASLHQVPCVVSRIGAVEEFLVDGDSGILVEPGDIGDLARGMERLLTDADLRARLATRARARSLQLFDREANMSVFDSLFDSALSTDGVAARKAVAMEV